MCTTQFTRPYFFEEHFPINYGLYFAPPVKRYSGRFNLPKEEFNKEHVDDQGFEVFLDVKDFQPNEINVRTVNEMVIVEGRQQKRPGNAVPRHFVRNFHLPEFYDSEDVFSVISDDGILEIKATPSSNRRTKDDK